MTSKEQQALDNVITAVEKAAKNKKKREEIEAANPSANVNTYNGVPPVLTPEQIKNNKP